MKTILFLHGFFASGNCTPALALRDAFEGRARVLIPDLPLRPKEALEFIHQLCDKERPDLLIGNSNGAFLAQIIAPIVGVPALLGNPHMEMTTFLKPRIGKQQYKALRLDGKQHFVIDESLIHEFEEVQNKQFNYTNPYWKDKIWGLFGQQDTLAQYKPLFTQHYDMAYDFPGGHTPTAEEVNKWYVPLAVKILSLYKRKAERFFQHFKGGKYRFVRTAFDSETQERMVIYQALYGEQNYWVRPEHMFFEKVTHEGRTFNRFTEISTAYQNDG